jgi:hypothetical protein
MLMFKQVCLLSRPSWLFHTAAAVSVLWLGIALAACDGASAPGPEGSLVRDSAGIGIVENTIPEPDSANTCHLADEPTLEIGVASGSSSHELYRAFDGARLSDGRIAIANEGSREVRVFGPDGSHFVTFGREGDGPGEFQRPYRLWRMSGDSILVFDSSHQRFSRFDADGAFGGAATLDPLYANAPDIVSVDEDGFLVAHHDFQLAEQGMKDQDLYAIRHAPDGAVADTLGRYGYGQFGPAGPPELHFVSGPVFQARTAVGGRAGTVYVGRGQGREVEVLSPDGSLTALYRWTGGSRDVTEDEIAERERSVREGAAISGDNRFADAMLDPTIPIAGRFPALSELEVDAGGNLWIRRYRRPTWEGPQPAIVLDPDGAFVCHGAIPEGMRLFEIGDDYLLGMERDDLGIEYVRMYEITRPE